MLKTAQNPDNREVHRDMCPDNAATQQHTLFQFTP